jgi:hypothetical protein
MISFISRKVAKPSEAGLCSYWQIAELTAAFLNTFLIMGFGFFCQRDFKCSVFGLVADELVCICLA